MVTLCKIVIMVLFSFARGDDTQDMEEIKEMMRDMNIRVQKAEEKWTKTEDKLAEALIELAETKTKLVTTENDLATTKHALNGLTTAQTETKTVLMKKDNELESEMRRMRRMRNPPYMHACGYQLVTTIKSATISYSRLLYSSTNTEGGGLDIASGVFTSSYPGSYTVTWGLTAYDGAGEHLVSIYLQHNGQNIEESFHRSYYEGPSGQIYDQGG